MISLSTSDRESDYTAALPSEVLGKIISAAGCPSFTSWTDILRFRYHVALVNKNWHNALAAERSVWNFLSIKRCTPPKFVNTCAANAGRGTLTLEIDSTAWHFAPQLKATTQLRRVCIPSMADFISVTLAQLSGFTPNLIGLIISAKVPRDMMKIAGTVAHLPMPQLRRVKLALKPQYQPDANAGAGIDLPSAMHITHMDLKATIDIPFRPAQYADLTGLRLTYIELDWKVLRAALQQCSDRLERLELDVVTAMHCEDGVGLVLGCLTTFHLGYATDVSTAMFALLSMPLVSNLRVEVMQPASLLAGYHANAEAFHRAEHITMYVYATETDSLGSILQCFTSAKELDLGFCSSEIAQGVLHAASGQLRLPRLQKIQIPDELRLEDMRVLFDNHFAPGLTVVTLYDDDGMVQYTDWTQDGDQLRSQSWGVREGILDYCGMDLDL